MWFDSKFIKIYLSNNNLLNNVTLIQWMKLNLWEVLRPQYFYNIFTTNHKWLVVIGSNLNLTLILIFYPNNNNQ